jgi:uncharacterized RDD family membrane protein YckC
MDDYYSLLGVDKDANTADIKEAYRERKASLDTGSDAGKADAAKLNKAWNVLSDPYQRGRYDAQREQGDVATDDTDTADADAADAPSTNGSASRSSRPARQPRQPRQPLVPTIDPPAGTSYPVPKDRLIAMGVDIFVILVLFIAAIEFVLPAVAHAQKPAEYDCANKLTTAVNFEQKAKDHTAVQTDPKIDDAKTTCQKAGVDVTGVYNTDNKALTDVQNKLTPIQNLVAGGFVLVGFLYLFIPSLIFGGATVGKRWKHLTVVRQDGSPATVGDLIKRYGPLALISYAGFFFLGPLVGVIVIVGISLWMRNPNMQGLHDRFAHTLVVKKDS